MRKTGIAFITTLLLCLALTAPAGAMSIQEVAVETPERWQGSYVNARGETITVDAEILVPDVEAVPILRVGCVDATALETLPAGTMESKGRIIYDSDTEHVVFGGSTSGGEFYQGYSYQPGAQAEYSPLTADEAKAFAETLLAPYCEAMGIEFRLTRMVAETRKYIVNNGVYTPVSSMGTYRLEYDQYLCGIPYIPNEQPFLKGIRLKKTEGIPYGGGSVSIASEDIYVISFCITQI